jgi:hypothetical protein
MRSQFASLILGFAISCLSPLTRAADPEHPTLVCDLLVVGGTEAGIAAAVQAARCGTSKIIFVSDTSMLGGQFSAEGVGAIDEWTTYKSKRVEFARSGSFSEIINRIHQENGKQHGRIRPGNGFCAAETIEPASAGLIFSNWLGPELRSHSGPIELRIGFRPVEVTVEKGAVRGVLFTSTTADFSFNVRTHMTIDRLGRCDPPFGRKVLRRP